MQELPTYAVYSTRKDEYGKAQPNRIEKIFGDKEAAQAFAARKRKELDKESRSYGDSFVVKKLSAEAAVERKQKDKKEQLTQAILSHAESQGPEVHALVKRLFLENDFTYEQLYGFDIDNLEYTTDASEYISSRNRASVWSSTVSGSIDLQGEVFSAENVQYNTETHRV